MISITRLFRLSIRIAAWATPHVKEWHRQRHLNRLEGQRHLESRNWSEAEHHLTLAIAERHQAGRRLDLLLQLAEAQRRQNKLAEAEQSVRTVIDAAAKARNQAKQAEALDALIEVQFEQGKYAEAEQTAREIARVSKLPERLAKCSHKLGVALLKNGRVPEAMEAFQKALNLSEQAFGAEHPETARGLSEIGALYQQQGKHAEAQNCFRRALEIQRKALGPNSHEAAQGLNNLAMSLEEAGDFESAASEYERVLAMKERQVGVNREDTADVQVRLAGLYLHVGRSSAARELLTHAIRVLESKGGQRLAIALETMARAEDDAGRGAEAKRWRERAMKLVSSLPV
jgi:tetratricopeptide (TPR) repeat protein